MRTKKLFLGACSLTLIAHLCNIGCSGESPKPSASAPPTPPVSEAAKADADAASKDASRDVASKDVTSKDEVKIMKEYWEGTKNLKFWNEMRRDENGRWDRNGIGRAYYAGGKLEREGMYRNGKRVGIWTYYDVDGKVSRTENRGDGGAADDAKSQS